MYNLSVSGNPESWNGDPWIIERSRCVREYTSDRVHREFGSLGTTEVDQLRRFPCIFAYEAKERLAPHFGQILDVAVRTDGIRVDYRLHPLPTFLSADQLERMSFELDISGWELNRTHWAVKEVDLAVELGRHGIILPSWTRRVGPRINLNSHQFDVALSFPGEVRTYVDAVARQLEHLLGPDRYFYDRNYIVQLARPSLDTFLQGIYRDRAKLIVVFVGRDYQIKDWCGIEFRAIREIINARQHDRVMIVRMDDGKVDGIMGHDGYIDARNHSPEDVAAFIEERVGLL
ncbi:MAG: TIR domain-containing protein [Marivivens sp.]